MAFPDDWNRKAELSIDGTKVDTTGASGGDLTAFPVVVTDANLPSGIFANAQNDGGDIRFTTDAAGNNPIPAEIVTFDTGGSTAEIWTRAPSLDGTDQSLYVWWENAGASQPAASDPLGRDAVWSSDFNAVWHLGESGSTFPDSTGNGNDGNGVDINDTAIDGPVGKAVDLRGNQDAIDTGQHSQFSDNDPFTVSFWWNRNKLDVNDRLFGFDTTDGFGTLFDGGFVSGSENLVFRSKTSSPSTVAFNGSDAENTWLRGTVVHDGAGGLELFVDGSPAGSATGVTWSAPDDIFALGDVGDGTGFRWKNNGDNFSGKLDQVSVSNAAKSEGWVKTAFNNQNDPASFASGGPAVEANAPSLVGSASTSFAEGGTGTFLDLDANDGGGPDTDITYSIVGGADSDEFSITSAAGALSFDTAPDFENPADDNADNAYVVEVEARDGNGNTAVQTVTVTVTDRAPTAPGDSDGASNEVAEDAGNGTGVGVTASGSDPGGGTVTYTLTDDAGGRFQIDSSTGAVTVASAGSLDHEASGSHTITVEGEDPDGDTSPTTDFTVTVTDADETPTITSGTSDSIAENAGNGDSVHDVQANVGGSDDEGVSYAITGGNGDGAYSIDSGTGEITVADAMKLDHEVSSSRSVTVEASEGSQTTTKSVSLNVTDVNETPSFAGAGTQTVNESSSAGTEVVDIDANVNANGNTPKDTGVSYALTAGNDDVAGDGGGAFAIDADGKITINDAGDIDKSAQSSFTVTVEASEGGQTATQDVTINVNDDVAPTLTGSTPADGTSSLAPGDDLALTFNEDVQTGSGNITITDEGDGSSTRTLDVTTSKVGVSGQTITLDPSSNLESGTDYHVEIDPTAIDDTNGNSFSGPGFSSPGVLNFTTADSDPAFTASDPVNVSILEDASVDLSSALEVGDTSSSDTLTWNVDAAPSQGSLSRIDNESLTTTSSNSPFTLGTSPSYSPNPDFNGSDSFDVKVEDANPGTTDTITVSVTINVVNDAPSLAIGGDQSVANDTSAQTVGGFASVPDFGAANESTQSVSDYTVTNDNNALFDGQPDIANTGDLTFNPKDGVEGSAVVDVSVTDDGGTSNGGSDTSATKSFTIAIDNAAPSIAGATVDGTSLTVTADETLSTASANVPESDDFTVTAGGQTISVANVSVTGSQIDLDLASAVSSGQSITLDYTQDTDIPEDTAGNQLNSFTGQTVSNATASPAPPPPPPPAPDPDPDPDPDPAPDPGDEPDSGSSGGDDGTPAPPQDLDPDDADLFAGDDQSSLDENPGVADGLVPTTDFQDGTIDGAPSTTGQTVDARGEAVTVTTIDPVADGQRVDDNPLTDDIDFQVDERVRTSSSDTTGLVVTERPGRQRDALAEIIASSGGSGDDGQDADSSAADARAAFLDTVAGSGGAAGTDVVEIAPQMPADSDAPAQNGGEQRLAVDTGRPAADGDGGERMTVVDTRGLPASADGDPEPITITGGGNVVVRGSGTFDGTDELADDGLPDPDNVIGDNSSQDLFFGPGDDTIRALGGNDRVASAGGRDRLFGGEGNDRVRGGAGDDMLDGGDQDDALTGGTGHDTLTGRGGDDAVQGGTGDDTLIGGGGHDALVGGGGADLLHGGDGDDALAGGPGADRLKGGAGDDVLIGGRGADTFVLDGAGNDRISDFDPADNTLVLTGASKTGDVAVTSTPAGHAKLDLAGGGSVTLIGVVPDALDTVDLAFA